jgi:hypothetical protein
MLYLLPTLPSIGFTLRNTAPVLRNVEYHRDYTIKYQVVLKDEVLLTVGCPIFPFYIDSQISVHRKFKKIDQYDIF